MSRSSADGQRVDPRPAELSRRGFLMQLPLMDVCRHLSAKLRQKSIESFTRSFGDETHAAVTEIFDDPRHVMSPCNLRRSVTEADPLDATSEMDGVADHQSSRDSP